MYRNEKTLEKRDINFKASDFLASDTTGRQIWQNVNSKRRLKRIQNLQKGKRHNKKKFKLCVVTNLSAP
jgi:hypothetical protein